MWLMLLSEPGEQPINNNYQTFTAVHGYDKTVADITFYR